MLILSRRSGESIRIGDEVTITILQIKGGQIKIGINAPKEIAVHREEVFQRLAQELPPKAAIVPDVTSNTRQVADTAPISERESA